ncbi:MAG: DUF3592 domain-containing protein [Candidatus Borkfalkiaceae bacterium]|nr:DUF3592 domain-containing protein [Christensenellaceae bacterium]
MKKSKIHLVFLVFGILFLAVGVFSLIRGIDSKTDTASADAEIVYISHSSGEDDSVYVKVSFTVDGVVYSGDLDTYVTGMKVGQIVPIRYKIADPNNFFYAKFTFLPTIICFLVGISFVSGSVVIIVIRAKTSAKFKALKKDGYKSYAKIVGVTVQNNVRVLEKNPVTITCSDDFGKTFVQKFLSSRGYNYTIGDQITVYVDKVNPDNYYVDTDEYLVNKFDKER